MAKNKKEKQYSQFAKPLVLKDHPKPVTRRQFLSQGLIASSGLMLMPQFLSFLLPRKALAAVNCGSGGTAANYVPYLVFDLAGGAGLAGNFLVGKQGGPEDYLKSYSSLGWNPKTSGALDKRFGIPMGVNVSKIFQGMTAAMSANAQANLRMGSLCNFSRDDSSVNLSSALALVSKMGYAGANISGGLGTVNSLSGGRSDVVGGDATLQPLYVSRVEDVLQAVGFGPFFSNFPIDSLSVMAKGTLNTSLEQSKQYLNMTGGQKLSDLATCAYQKNVDTAKGVTGMDPRLDSIFSSVYNLSNGTATDSPEAIAATIVLNVLDGSSGPGVITIGGCDYHTGSQTDGDNKDLEIGTQIGRAVEAAHRLNKPLFFHVITDGGIYAADGTRNWTGDSGERSMTILGHYDPKAVPSMKRLQVGSYTDGQGVDRSSLVGDDPSKAAYAAFANYLNVMGRLSDFSKFAPSGIFSADQLDSVLIFG